MIHFIPLKLAQKFEKLAALRGVSAVARGESKSSQTEGGFFETAKRVHGNVDRLKRMPVRKGASQTWWERRNAFCIRHYVQQVKHREPNIETSGKFKGTPTRRELGLIMWMGSSLSPQKLVDMLPLVKHLTSQRA